MPKPLNAKCAECSCHATEWAKTVHGEYGDNCWNPKRCHNRRSFYRLRGSFMTNSASEVISIAPPISYYAILYLYKEPGEKPLHAIGAELWYGQQAVCKIEPVHCFGLTAGKIRIFSQQVLQAFSDKYQVNLPQYKEMFELSPDLCPIRPCPLYQEHD